MEGPIKETKNFCIGDLVMFKDGSRHTHIGEIIMINKLGYIVTCGSCKYLIGDSDILNHTPIGNLADNIKVGDAVFIRPGSKASQNVSSGLLQTFIVDWVNCGMCSISIDNSPIEFAVTLPTSDVVKIGDTAIYEQPPKFVLDDARPAINIGAYKWIQYEADLAKEIVLKTINNASDKRPNKVAEYAVKVARGVVKRLKN